MINNLNTVDTSGTLVNMRLFRIIIKSTNYATLEVCCIFWNNIVLHKSICFTNDKVKCLKYGSTKFFFFTFKRYTTQCFRYVCILIINSKQDVILRRPYCWTNSF